MDRFDKNSESKNQFYERPFVEVEGGYIDDRGFYTTPNGSFWDEDHNYFNHLGFDSEGGMYDKYGTYIPCPNYDEKNEENDNKKFDTRKNIEIAISKLKEQEKTDEKIIKKFGNLEEEESEISDDENNSSFDEDEFKEAYEDVLEHDIELNEILNPEINTGIIERDFHLYVYKPKKQPEYVHIEEDEEPICTCKMHNKDIDLKSGEKCIHIFFVLNEILGLNFDKGNLSYKGDVLKELFQNAESNNPNIIRETYGIVKRKNFIFPSPKIYKYEINETELKDKNNINEWKIKEILFARGIVADEFIFPGITYSLIEKTYDNYFKSEKEAKPTKKAYEKSKLYGRQLELDKIYNK